MHSSQLPYPIPPVTRTWPGLVVMLLTVCALVSLPLMAGPAFDVIGWIVVTVAAAALGLVNVVLLWSFAHWVLARWSAARWR